LVIENVGGILKPRIPARAPTKLTELKWILQEEWTKFNQETIDALICSPPNRFRLRILEQWRTISNLGRLNQGPREIYPVPEGVLTPRLVHQNHVGETVLIRGVATRITWRELTREFEIHFMDESLFTPRGEMPRSIRVRATGDRTAFPIKDVPTILEGEVILARDDWFTPIKTSGSARKRHTHFAIQLCVRLTRVVKEATPENGFES
jgi:hypothetical protein